ncbi:MAG: ATP-binding protein [Planctomycetes bacterium]|nr:ATP-binding protein [Planctomycetota bacterium]
MSDAAALYREILDGVREDLVTALGKGRHALWFRDTEVVRVSGRSVVLAVPTEVHRTWLEFNYRAEIDRAFGRVLGEGVHVELVVQPRLDEARAVRDHVPADEAGWRDALRDVRPAPTLLSFVSDEASAFAVRLAEQALHGSGVGAPPPTCFFGGPGTGKSHLLRALERALAADAGACVAFTAKRFTARVVAATRAGDSAALARLTADVAAARVVLLDDLDDLADRPATQHVLEGLLDTAAAHGGRFVVAGREHPRAVEGLSERLRSRLLAGVLFRLAEPSRETRGRIVAGRATALGLEMPDDVRDAILVAAPSVEAAAELADRWAFVSRRAGRPVEASHLLELAPPASPSSPREDVVRRAKDAVARHYGVDRRALDRPTKRPTVLEARRTAMYLVWRAAKLPLTELATAFGLRSHSAASRAITEVREQREIDPGLEVTLDGLLRAL